MSRILSFVLFAQAFLGCAIGQTIDFRRQTVSLAAYSPSEMPGTFRVGVLDARGETDAQVGTNHAFIPIPWPVMSESGKPLADDTAGAIVEGFERTRLAVYRVNIAPKSSVSDARVEVRPFRGGAGFLFTIREFWVRTWLSTSFSYDVLLEVLDADGAIVASAEAKDVESLGDYTPPQLAGQLFSRLLVAPQIRGAAKRLTQRSAPASPQTPSADPPKPSSAPPPPPLPEPATEQPATKPSVTTPTKPPAARASKCSVEQVLKMKAMALTDEQIRAACPD